MKALCLLLVLLTLCSCELRVRVSPDSHLSNDHHRPEDTADEEEVGVAPEEEGVAEEEEEEEAWRRERDRERSIYTQSIAGNTSTDTVTIEIEWTDGTIISQLTDFRARSQLMRVLIPGEEDLGHPPFQAFCFVSSFGGDLISPEAVTKLRQKNPEAVRSADEDRGEVVQDSPLKVNREATRLISSHTASFCKDARDSTLSSEHELFNILESGGSSARVSELSREAIKDSEHLPRCFAVEDRRHPCVCSLRICLDWYPCALKYCKNKEGEGEHRCGIKTCRKCLTYRYPIRAKNLCMWDEV